MYKVMLVDDEKQIIQGLTHIIDWDRLNCQVIGAAYNGKMGIEQAIALTPDIIVTDIKMPYKDGLEMIAAIQEQLPEIRYVILSGYSEFDYAKQGIKLGVKDYVLKPVEETELEASLQRIVDKLDDEKEAQMKQKEELAATRRAFVLEQLIRDLFAAGEDNAYIIDEFADQGIEFKHQYITCMIAHVDSPESVSKVDNLSLQTAKDYTSIFVRLSLNEYALLLNHAWSAGFNFYTTIETLKSTLAKKMNANISLAVGATFSSLKQISTSIEQARYVTGYFLLGSEKDIVFYEQLEDATSLVKLPDELYDQLFTKLEQLRLNKVLATIAPLMRSLIIWRHQAK